MHLNGFVLLVALRVGVLVGRTGMGGGREQRHRKQLRIDRRRARLRRGETPPPHATAPPGRGS